MFGMREKYGPYKADQPLDKQSFSPWVACQFLGGICLFLPLARVAFLYQFLSFQMLNLVLN